MKKTTFLKSIILIMLFFVPILGYSQTPANADGYAKAISFMQGDGVLETWFTESFLPLYDTFMKQEYGKLILVGQAIAGVFALLYMGNLGFGMLSGDKQWEVMPMLKPFAIGLVLINWVGFTDLIKAPLKALQQYAQEDFQEAQNELNALRVKRYQLQQLTLDVVFAEQAKAQAEIAQQEAGSKNLLEQGVDLLSDGVTSLLTPLYEAYMRLQAGLQLAIASLLELVGLWILRICTYLIFFLQLMYSTILIIIGPISIGMSVLPMFSSSFSNWITKFININLYGFMAFTVLKLGTLLQQFAYEAEIDRYLQMIDEAGNVKNKDLILTFASGGTMTFGLVIICFVISGIGVLSVPSLANMVVSANGNSATMGQLKRAGMAIATKGTSLFKGK